MASTEDAVAQIVQTMKQGVNGTLNLLKYLVGNFVARTNEVLPSVNAGVTTLLEKGKTEGLPLLKERGSFWWERARSQGLPLLRERGSFCWEKAKSEGLPFLKRATWFLLEKMKAHPWASASAVLILLLYFTRRSGGSPPKMMRAPGRPGQWIPRPGFESNPADYFRGLRADV